MPTVRLFLCGDVMLGRGVDCIMPHPGSPTLHEEFVKSAADYVLLAERKNGFIAKPVGYEYVWGDALADLARENPTARIVNLETSVTVSNDFLPKGINYRMHPANIEALTAARIDCCVLANNHVLDWGTAGLEETLRTLKNEGIRAAGAGATARDASAPAVIPLGDGRRLLVFAFALASSGVPSSWAAGEERQGVNLLSDVSEATVETIAGQVRAMRHEGDLLIASVHWGGNWGYAIASDQRALAHRLTDVAGFQLVHGHSSHHAKAIEIHHGRLILYGCGDFITDYEGIPGYEEFRNDLSLAYFPELSPSGDLIDLKMRAYALKKLRLNRASSEDVGWLARRLDRESSRLGIRVTAVSENVLAASI
jgi:poly-gamma-glutamate synthesis protein (capsule biosynthesis protein)